MSVGNFSSAKMWRAYKIKTDQMNLLLNESDCEQITSELIISVSRTEHTKTKIMLLIANTLFTNSDLEYFCVENQKFHDAIDIEQHIDHNNDDSGGSTILHSMKIETLLPIIIWNEDEVFESVEDMESVSYEYYQISYNANSYLCMRRSLRSNR